MLINKHLIKKQYKKHISKYQSLETQFYTHSGVKEYAFINITLTTYQNSNSKKNKNFKTNENVILQKRIQVQHNRETS